MDISRNYNWINLTPEEGHYTFGYYDRCAWNSDNKLHLALRIPQQEWLPLPGEPAAVGYVDLSTRHFHKTGETLAWCHQQGAITLWLKHRPCTFVYNDFVREGMLWRPIARIFSLEDGDMGQYEVPLYAMSSDGRWGATLNFNRIPRRGYSYALAELPLDSPEPDLDNDGLFLVDMHSGDLKLIASYRDLIAAHPFSYDLEGVYMWLNHAIFNCDASEHICTRCVLTAATCAAAFRIFSGAKVRFHIRFGGGLKRKYWSTRIGVGMILDMSISSSMNPDIHSWHKEFPGGWDLQDI